MNYVRLETNSRIFLKNNIDQGCDKGELGQDLHPTTRGVGGRGGGEWLTAGWVTLEHTEVVVDVLHIWTVWTKISLGPNSLFVFLAF